MKIFKYLIIVTVLISCKLPDDNLSPNNKSFKAEMSQTVVELSQYIKKVNPNFKIITENGIELFLENESINTSYLSAIDGQLVEGQQYGKRTVNEVVNEIDKAFFDKYIGEKTVKDLPILNIDYCNIDEPIKSSLQKNKILNHKLLIAFEKSWTNLNAIKAPILDENSNNITNLREAKNFYFLPKNAFASKEFIFENLRNANHDVIILNPYFNNTLLTKAELDALKVKKNGGKRLVFAYFNLALADAKQNYWLPEWKLTLPDFVNKEIGNEFTFRVNYWDKNWQNVVFGNEKSIISNFNQIGFSGCYLADIEAYKLYE